MVNLREEAVTVTDKERVEELLAEEGAELRRFEWDVTGSL
jgi:hypothetical protein